MQDPYTRVSAVDDRCAQRYQTALLPALREEESTNLTAAKKWKKYTTEDGRDYYFNKETQETQWLPPEEVNSCNLNLEEVQGVVDKCNSEQARWDQFVQQEPAIVKLQAHVRGLWSAVLRV